jgi:hypothetical protein
VETVIARPMTEVAAHAADFATPAVVKQHQIDSHYLRNGERQPIGNITAPIMLTAMQRAATRELAAIKALRKRA